MLSGGRAGEGGTTTVWGMTYLDVLEVGAAPAIGQRGAFPLPVLQEQHGPQSHKRAEEDGAFVVKEPAGLRRGGAGRRARTLCPGCWGPCARPPPAPSGDGSAVLGLHISAAWKQVPCVLVPRGWCPECYPP